MFKTKKVLSLILFPAVSILAGCGGCGPGTNNGDPNRGFDLLPNRIEISQTTGSQIHRSTTMRVISQFLEPQGTIRGTIEFFSARDIGPAAQNFLGAKVPASWRFQYVEINQIGRIPCQDGVQTVERNVGVGELETLHCRAFVFPIAISPNAIDVQSPPVKIEITAEGVSSEFGPPQIAILNEFGQLKAWFPATVVNLGKGKIEFNTPNLNGYSNGVYQISINNVRANGAFDVVGAGEISIYGNAPPEPPNYPNPCSIPAPCLF